MSLRAQVAISNDDERLLTLWRNIVDDVDYMVSRIGKIDFTDKELLIFKLYNRGDEISHAILNIVPYNVTKEHYQQLLKLVNSDNPMSPQIIWAHPNETSSFHWGIIEMDQYMIDMFVYNILKEEHNTSHEIIPKELKYKLV